MTPPLHAFGLLAFTYFATIGLFNPYAPLWFKEMGLSTVAIGTIATLQSLSRIVAPYAWSWAGDHSGRRVEVIRWAAAGALLAALGLLGVDSAVPLALVTMTIFVANGGVVPLYEAVLGQILAKGGEMDAQRYGRVRVWGSIGFLASVLGAGVLLQAVGIRAFPYVVAVANALLLWAALRLPPTRSDAVHAQAPPPALPVLRQPAVAWFFASVFFTVLAHVSQYAFFSLYLDSLGYAKSSVGGLWALAVVAEIVFFWMQGRWFRLLSPGAWLVAVAVASMLRFALTAAAGDVAAVLVVSQLLHAISFGAHHVVSIYFLTRFFPDRLRGRGQALYSILGYGISGALGGVGGGWLIAHLGFAAVFWAATLSAAVGVACAWQVQRALVRPALL